MPKFNCAFHQTSGVLKIKIKIAMLFRPCPAQYEDAFNISHGTLQKETLNWRINDWAFKLKHFYISNCTT